MPVMVVDPLDDDDDIYEEDAVTPTETAREMDMLALQLGALEMTHTALLAQLAEAKALTSAVQQSTQGSKHAACRRRPRSDDDDCVVTRVRYRDADQELSEASSMSTIHYRGSAEEEWSDDEGAGDMPCYRGISIPPQILKSSSGPEDEFDGAYAGGSGAEVEGSLTYRSAGTPLPTRELDLSALKEVVAALTDLAAKGADAEESAVLQQLTRVREVLTC